MKNIFDLSGKVAVITGGAGVLCSEMSKRLGSIGVKVAVLDLSLERANEVARDIIDSRGTAIGVHVNVLDKESIIKAKDEVIKHFGRVDILINGAGGNKI